MQTGTGGIGKHIEHIILRSRCIIFRFKRFMIAPVLLPFSFYFPEIIFHSALKILRHEGKKRLHCRIVELLSVGRIINKKIRIF